MSLSKGVSTFKGLFIIYINYLRRRIVDLNSNLKTLVEFQQGEIIVSLCKNDDYSYRSRNMLIRTIGKT